MSTQPQGPAIPTNPLREPGTLRLPSETAGVDYSVSRDGTGELGPTVGEANRSSGDVVREAILTRLYDRRAELLASGDEPLPFPETVELSEIEAELDRQELAGHEIHAASSVGVLRELTGRLLAVRAEIERHRR